MKCLYLDCFAGISGDMTIGALLDLGLDLQTLEHELAKLCLTGYRLEVKRVDKCGLRATQFKVILVEDEHDAGRDADSGFVETDPDAHSHGQAHDAGHEHSHEGPHDHHDHRSLRDILRIIASSDLSDRVKDRASAIFTRLGQAEATVHGVDVQEVQFHEVGGVDAIVDITGAVIGLELLGVECVMASPLHLGSGFVRMSHGTYPIPAPATAQLVRGVPVYATEAKGELVTPTGAAIVTTLAQSFGSLPPWLIERVGYGAGSRDRDFPNVVRAYLGELSPGELSPNELTPERIKLQASPALAPGREPRSPHPEQHSIPVNAQGYQEQTATVIEASIDDMNPQHFEALLASLLLAGALDAILIPAQMKKQRPGTLLQVVAHSADVNDLISIIFRESTTIGLRSYDVKRTMLPRETRQVTTPYGVVRVKVARRGDEVLNIAPEYEDCRALAQQHGVALKLVHAAALAAATPAP